MGLYELADNCNYRSPRGEMICARLVVGIQDCNLSERLQLDADLNLNKAKKAIHQCEAVHKQQQMLNGPTESSSITAPLTIERRRRQRSNGQPRNCIVTLPLIPQRLAPGILAPAVERNPTLAIGTQQLTTCVARKAIMPAYAGCTCTLCG